MTFSWHESSGEALLTHSAARAAGIPTSGDKQFPVRVAGKNYRAVRVTVPYVQVGHHLLKDVSAGVLPPEAEDAGSFIGAGALQGLRANLNEQALRLQIQKSP